MKAAACKSSSPGSAFWPRYLGGITEGIPENGTDITQERHKLGDDIAQDGPKASQKLLAWPKSAWQADENSMGFPADKTPSTGKHTSVLASEAQNRYLCGRSALDLVCAFQPQSLECQLT